MTRCLLHTCDAKSLRHHVQHKKMAQCLLNTCDAKSLRHHVQQDLPILFQPHRLSRLTLRLLSDFKDLVPLPSCGKSMWHYIVLIRFSLQSFLLVACKSLSDTFHRMTHVLDLWCSEGDGIHLGSFVCSRRCVDLLQSLFPKGWFFMFGKHWLCCRNGVCLTLTFYVCTLVFGLIALLLGSACCDRCIQVGLDIREHHFLLGGIIGHVDWQGLYFYTLYHYLNSFFPGPRIWFCTFDLGKLCHLDIGSASKLWQKYAALHRSHNLFSLQAFLLVVLKSLRGASHRTTHVLDRWCSEGEGIHPDFFVCSHRSVSFQNQKRRPGVQQPKGKARPYTFFRSLFAFGGFVTLLSCKTFERIGEASNPGPDFCQEFVTIGTINPTQIYQKEEIVASYGSGVWTFSETSHTSLTRGLSQRRFQTLGFQTQWSVDCEPLEPKKGMFRGKASGTCIASSYPLRSSHFGISSQVLATKRYSEAVVQLSHDTCMLVISLYGPTYGNTYSNPERLLNEISYCAFDRGFNFKGPVVICADLNVDLDDIPIWDKARHKGWQDLHVLSAFQNEHELEPTCRNARHSFILGNAAVCQALIRCRTHETYDFSMHPVLFAELKLSTITKGRVHWRLPKSCDDLLVDPDLYRESVSRCLVRRKQKLLEAVHLGKSDVACKVFNQIYESSLCQAIVQTDGAPGVLPRSCLGKTKDWPFVSKPPSQPVCRIGRPGDIQPIGMQTSIEVRRLLRQSRRLQSLKHQLKACQRRPNLVASFQCQQLWDAILGGTGFHVSFSHWISVHCDCFIPLQCPTLEYVEHVAEVFNRFYKNKAQHQFLVRQRNRKSSVALDIEKGGSKMFAEAREPPHPPLDQVAWTDRWKVVRERWSKHGKNTIRSRGHKCCIHDQVTFQGQSAIVVDINGDLITLDRTIFLRSGGTNGWKGKTIQPIPKICIVRQQKHGTNFGNGTPVGMSDNGRGVHSS